MEHGKRGTPVLPEVVAYITISDDAEKPLVYAEMARNTEPNEFAASVGDNGASLTIGGSSDLGQALTDMIAHLTGESWEVRFYKNDRAMER